MALLWRYLLSYRRTLAGALLLAVVNQTFSLLDPQIFRLIIDNYATRIGEIPQGDFVRGVVLLLLASVGAAFVSRVAKNFQDYYANVVTQRVGARMYNESVRHSFALPYEAFEDQRSGELLQKLQKARIDAQQFILNSVNIVFFAAVGILIVVAYAFFVHWAIGLSYLLVIPAVGTVTMFIGRRIKGAQALIVRESAELAGSTTETLRNVELVKSLGLEGQETERLNTVNERILDLELKKVRMIRTLSFLQGTTVNAVRTGILFLMLWLVSRGSMTVGELFTLLFYSFAIFAPLGDLGQVISSYQEARASLEQVERVLAMPPAPQPAHPRDPGRLRTIELRKVGFDYAGGEGAVRGITLAMHAGETIAFVGPSGAGKTTIVKLLLGLYPPKEGTLLVNDIDSRTLDQAAFRARVGYVSQDTQLFAGTVRENLLFVRPNATDAECLSVLKRAEALSILERARSIDPGKGGKGLDTKIGEGGIKLSGGERQRLAIARALLREPDLVVFDEATSSLDSITERAITDTVRGIAREERELMTVMIAHRLSTVAHADRILVLAHGKIVETGTHAELAARGGLYAALWAEQQAGGNGSPRFAPEARAMAAEGVV